MRVLLPGNPNRDRPFIRALLELKGSRSLQRGPRGGQGWYRFTARLGFARYARGWIILHIQDSHKPGNMPAFWAFTFEELRAGRAALPSV